MRFLRQSTDSQEILLGPFVAASDGSAQTGLTIANTDIKLLKGGATAEGNKNSGGGTHMAGGRYSAVLDATDTDTVGILEVSVNPTSGVPWTKSYYVFEEAVFDALYASGAGGYGTAQTGDSYARLGAPAGASVSADVAAIKSQTAAIETDTQDLQTQIGTAGAGLTVLATAANLATVDTAVDAIKTKTDSLTFTVTGQVDANIESVNGTEVIGDGAPGTEWNPAP